MAEDPPKLSSPHSAQATIPAVDGSTDQPSNTAAGLPPDPPSQPAQDGGGDTIMTSPTAPRTAAPATASALPITTSGPVPLDSPLRTTPIHPSLPSVKVPEAALTSAAPNTNPITLQPFTEAELTKYGFEKLRTQILGAAAMAAAMDKTIPRPTAANGGGMDEKEREEISRVRDETAALLKQKLDEREARVREIEREMEEKEKIREVERKVFRKKLAGAGRGV
ncbi:uncharacterized protein Z520_03808 [Fonsecaea multimorphosa CBS 102226]|uniref:Uncharacterized protein n=1 Tax=Fonsecaea multimorphosa CBS 102226 TaxID=1442371 RepID=A0A0D2K2N7_9EURO|nr:uncharacterized protein Z520_03808 [Fonsecaea multimorphosa CBS 102226]KIY00123.1 hypothetical protein Z520_03808 [Fonsecaea multimorphosa CBS 102226]OAL27318.1 hypothetical protein AYO22_03593 [Fonsecaea multimorphosa]